MTYVFWLTSKSIWEISILQQQQQQQQQKLTETSKPKFSNIFCYFLILLYAAAAATVVAEKKLKISEIKIVRFPLSQNLHQHKLLDQSWVPPKLSGFICAYHPAAPGSSPKHASHVKRTKRGRVWPIEKTSATYICHVKRTKINKKRPGLAH